MIDKDELIFEIENSSLASKTKQDYINLLKRNESIEELLEKYKNQYTLNILLSIIKRKSPELYNAYIKYKKKQEFKPFHVMSISELYEKRNLFSHNTTTLYLYYLKLLTGHRVKTFLNNNIYYTQPIDSWFFYVSNVKREYPAFMLPVKLLTITLTDINRFNRCYSNVFKDNVQDPIRKSWLNYISTHPKYSAIDTIILGHNRHGQDRAYIRDLNKKMEFTKEFYEEHTTKYPFNEIWNKIKYIK